jgi:hypothetical protein
VPAKNTPLEILQFLLNHIISLNPFHPMAVKAKELLSELSRYDIETGGIDPPTNQGSIDTKIQNTAQTQTPEADSYKFS